MQFFEIFAECSIALLGFGAIHAVLRGSDRPRGLIRAWVVVTQGAFAFLLSILPLLLALSSLSADMVWRAASAIGVICVSILVYVVVIFDHRLTELGYPPQAPLNLFLAKLISIIAIVTMILNALGWPWPPGALQHGIAVTLTLVTGLLALIHTFYVPVQLLISGKDIKDVDDTQN